ncbi:aldehyde dehydrogenase (NAD+) [Marivirga sericea]|uniref:Aldehyde dehydrogenase n=1 Tax=Marivirga sericea TaxID=1028 RepID=A0A1X7I6I3_9BACT|nr:aldehyde dehydrogenase family protein [Marivirga sericea]SMG09891.1 aldehyde dehydrogenase (NAD+) [Marivirga sericea]
MEATLEAPVEAKISDIQRIFDKQHANYMKVGNTTVSERKAKLKKFHQVVEKYRPQIKEAMYNDYRKHPSEVDLTEVYPVTSEIKHARRKLRSWMGKQHISTPLALLGSTSKVHYEPKGMVLIISPWNFPFNLTFGPLVSAVAAGNTVIIKPSEMTPHSSALMGKLLAEVFEENEVAVIEGGKDTSTELLALKFNHIFFTGAPSIGKIVMAAAAKHLTSVTLELGGKSPTIVDETADLKMAARRVAWGKCLNNGQVCIAPDYVFVHESKKAEFVSEVNKAINHFYSENASEESSYARIVNEHHFNRIKSYVDDAVSKGAKVELGAKFDESQNYISPTVMTNVSNDSKLMTNEIFGPIMPIFTFKDVNEAIDQINEREKPLALYIFSKSNKNINHILKNTRAGGGCINHSSVHFFNTNLPFGGSNNSGIGKGHGFDGFKAFSNARGVLRQHVPNALELLLPPYTNFSQKLIDFTIKYF